MHKMKVNNHKYLLGNIILYSAQMQKNIYIICFVVLVEILHEYDGKLLPLTSMSTIQHNQDIVLIHQGNIIHQNHKESAHQAVKTYKNFQNKQGSA